MRHVVTLLVGAAAGAAAVTALRSRRGPDRTPGAGPTAASPLGSGRVAVDVSQAPSDPV